ncbi:CHST1-like protein [Mya arenaria]|uniref:CHST1-like protein n=1 Tax=Mya arenaria TaxID=6604 RepID=A0ABY7DPC7_MYAAR|nr:carbohydrate sulfotransferase 1-like isoform X2 [Mya arenaria]WAQ99556.1 CHST1-like protein [Mya arenaria]
MDTSMKNSSKCMLTLWAGLTVLLIRWNRICSVEPMTKTNHVPRAWNTDAPDRQMGSATREYQPDQLHCQNRPIDNVTNSPQSHAIRGSNIISNASIVLIVAYMRTGSTLLGEILREVPESFYIFEPLRTIESKFNRQNTGDKKNKSVEINTADNITRLLDKNSAVDQSIKSILTCHLESLEYDILTDRHHALFKDSMKDAVQCARGNINKGNKLKNLLLKTNGTSKAKLEEDIEHANNDIRLCLAKEKELCSNSFIIVIKTIRLRMRRVLQLIPHFPNMKVIHLLRDPRGMFQSWANTGFRADFSQIAKECHTLSTNIAISKSIIHQYPEKLKIIQYEELAEFPYATTKEIFDFVGLAFSEKIQKFLSNKTSSETHGSAYDTNRRNSTETASKWRKNISFADAQTIDAICVENNEVLGYLPVKTEQELRNMSLSLRIRQNVTQALIKSYEF